MIRPHDVFEVEALGDSFAVSFVMTAASAAAPDRIAAAFAAMLPAFDVRRVHDPSVAQVGRSEAALAWALLAQHEETTTLAVMTTTELCLPTDLVDFVDAFNRSYQGTAATSPAAPSRWEPAATGCTASAAFASVSLDPSERAAPPLALPGRLLPAVGTAASYHTVVRELTPETVGGLTSFARASGAEPPTIIAAAFAALLHRLTGETDVACNVRHATRDGASRSLRLRLEFDDATTVRATVERTQRALDASLLEQCASAPCGVSVDVRMHTGTPGPFVLANVAAPAEAPAFDALAVRCFAEGNRVRLCWQFNQHQYATATVEHFALLLESLLMSAIAQPEQVVGKLTLLDASEREARIAAGRGRVVPYERDTAIGDVFARQASRSPDAVALVDEFGQLTYAELDRRANQLANHLIANGIAAGSRVGITFDRSIDLPVALLAILKTGAAYVPLDLAYPRERLDLMIADAGIEAIVSRGPTDERLAFAGCTIALDRESVAIAERSVDAPLVAVSGDAMAYITYTSGSTGRPKGVAVPHRGVVRLVRAADYVSIAPDDGYLQHAPLAFDASTFEIWAPLLNGARLGIPRSGLLSVDDLADAVDRFGVTTLFLTTALFGRVVDRGKPEFRRLRRLLTGGEVASPAHMRRFLATYSTCRLIAVYGPTENTTFSTWHPLPDATAVGANVPIGRPIANSTAYVVDGRGMLVPVGVPGELWVGGDGVAAGYVNRPDLTEERFIPDAFAGSGVGQVYRTGDRVRWRADDVLEFLGRTDDQVKIRGFRIELGEIESVLQAHPDVADAAVVVAPRNDDKALFAFVAPRPGSRLDDTELRSYLARKLPRYMLPHRLCVLAALPENASGKVDRIALTRHVPAIPGEATVDSPKAAAAPSQPPAARAALRPGGALRERQHALAELWRETLELDAAPGIDVNFFDAGGDSLRLLAVHANIQERLGLRVPIMALFEQTTIRKLAAFLAQTDA